jgi:hypothetical protein
MYEYEVEDDNEKFLDIIFEETFEDPAPEEEYIIVDKAGNEATLIDLPNLAYGKLVKEQDSEIDVPIPEQKSYIQECPRRDSYENSFQQENQREKEKIRFKTRVLYYFSKGLRALSKGLEYIGSKVRKAYSYTYEKALKDPALTEYLLHTKALKNNTNYEIKNGGHI